MSPRNGKQNESRFYPYGTVDFPTLVAEIFFPTNRHMLDKDDTSVLKNLFNKYANVLLFEKAFFQIEGMADARGDEDYNLKLGLLRAKSVKKYLDMKFKSVPNASKYNSICYSMGESAATNKNHAADRCVGIYATPVLKRPRVNFLPRIIRGEYNGPLSNVFELSIVGGIGGSKKIGAQALYLDIKNWRTKVVAKYMYKGVGFSISSGLPVSVTTATVGYIKIPDWIDEKDFEGSGSIASASLGKSKAKFRFNGPKERGKTNYTLDVVVKGYDFFSVGASGDFESFSRWERR